MPTYSDWRTDSTPREILLYSRPADASNTWGSQSYGVTTFPTETADTDPSVLAAVQEAWSLAGTVDTGAPIVGYFGRWATSSTTQTVRWGTIWVTGSFPSDLGWVGQTSVPASVYDDPNVVGIEWDTTPVDPVSIRANVEVNPGIPSVFYGRDLPVLYEPNVGSRYEPPAETRTQILARPQVGAIQYRETGTQTVDIPVLVGAGGSFAVGVIDPWTATGAVEGITSGDDDFEVRLRAYGTYRPRYRLVYADAGPTMPVCRLEPRKDGRGPLGGPKRLHHPGDSRQGGFRPPGAPGSYY